MSRRQRKREAYAQLAVRALKEEGKLGKLLEHEPKTRAGRKIQELLMDAARQESKAAEKEVSDEN